MALYDNAGLSSSLSDSILKMRSIIGCVQAGAEQYCLFPIEPAARRPSNHIIPGGASCRLL